MPGEIIIGESPEGAYIYKATLKVMLEEDYLNQKTEKPKNRKTEIYNFSDPRLKELNQYSTQLIKETIIPKLTYEVNTSKRYAPLRQVYYSLILAQWFKQKYGRFRSTRTQEHKPEQENPYIKLINSGDLTNLAAKEPYDKQSYFQQYQKSFKDGEYNLQEPVHTPAGQSIRRYVSGGIGPLDCSSAINAGKVNIANRDIRRQYLTVSHIKDKTTTLSSPLRSHSSRSAIKAALRVMRGFTFPESNIPSDGILNIPYSVISTEANNVPESIDLILKLKICSGREYKNFHFYDMRSFKDTRFRNAIYIRDIKTKKDVLIGLKLGFKDEIFIDWLIDEESILTNYKISADIETDEDGKRFLPLDISKTLKAIWRVSDLILETETSIDQSRAKKFAKDVIGLYQKGRLTESFIMDKITATFGQELVAPEKELLRKIVVLDTTEDGLANHLREFRLLLYRHNIVLNDRGRSAKIIKSLGNFIKKTEMLTDILSPEEGAAIKNVFLRLERVIRNVSSAITKEEFLTEDEKQNTSASSAAENSFQEKKEIIKGLIGKISDNKRACQYRAIELARKLNELFPGMDCQVYYFIENDDMGQEIYRHYFVKTTNMNYVFDAALDANKYKNILPNQSGIYLMSENIIEQVYGHSFVILPKDLDKFMEQMKGSQSDKGGIDFTRPEIVTRQMDGLGSLAGSPLSINPNLDFEAEWGGIQAVFNAGSGLRPGGWLNSRFLPEPAH